MTAYAILWWLGGLWNKDLQATTEYYKKQTMEPPPIQTLP